MADEQFKVYQKVSCLCGASIRVDPSSTDRRVTCPSCGSNFDFVVTLDAAKKRARVSIVLSRAAMKTEGDSLGKASDKPAEKPAAAAKVPAPKPAPTPPPTPSRVTRKISPKTVYALTGTCECGTEFPLYDTGELATVQDCPECSRTYHVVFKLEHGTRKKTAIMVPDKPTLPKSRTLAAPKPPKGATRTGKTVVNDPGSRVTDFFTPSGKRTRVPKAKAKAAPPEIPPGSQGVPCSCGEIFVVKRKDVGRTATCEGCGRSATFEEARDPQSLAPIIRIRTT